MSFVSAYYKKKESFGLGHMFNVFWLMLTIMAVGTLLTYNSVCLHNGNCDVLSWLIVVVLVGITIFHITWAVYKTVKEKTIESKPPTEESN